LHTLVALWLAHIVIAAWAVVPMAVIGRRRAAWESWEALDFVVPFWTWALLMLSPAASGKSLANLGEAGYISAAIIVATAVRLFWGQRPHKRLLSALLLAAVVGVAVGGFFLTSPTSEVRSIARCTQRRLVRLWSAAAERPTVGQ